MNDETRERLRGIARGVCDGEGWPWLQPVEIKKRWGKYLVITNARSIGCNARVEIDRKTLQVIARCYAPR